MIFVSNLKSILDYLKNITIIDLSLKKLQFKIFIIYI